MSEPATTATHDDFMACLFERFGNAGGAVPRHPLEPRGEESIAELLYLLNEIQKRYLIENTAPFAWTCRDFCYSAFAQLLLEAFFNMEDPPVSPSAPFPASLSETNAMYIKIMNHKFSFGNVGSVLLWQALRARQGLYDKPYGEEEDDPILDYVSDGEAVERVIDLLMKEKRSYFEVVSPSRAKDPLCAEDLEEGVFISSSATKWANSNFWGVQEGCYLLGGLPPSFCHSSNPHGVLMPLANHFEVSPYFYSKEILNIKQMIKSAYDAIGADEIEEDGFLEKIGYIGVKIESFLRWAWETQQKRPPKPLQDALSKVWSEPFEARICGNYSGASTTKRERWLNKSEATTFYRSMYKGTPSSTASGKVSNAVKKKELSFPATEEAVRAWVKKEGPPRPRSQSNH